MSNFYYLHFANVDGLAFAGAPYDPKLHRRLAMGGMIEEWSPPKFELGRGLLVDYLANTFAFRLCSPRLHAILEGCRSMNDAIQWLPTPVALPDGRTLPYSILHFAETPEVIHRTKSILAGPSIVKACLDSNLVGVHRVLSLPEDTLRLIVAAKVKESVIDSGCTGIMFSKVPEA